MNKSRADAEIFCAELVQQTGSILDRVDMFVVPPFTQIERVAGALDGRRIAVGAQNMHWHDEGAWTGEISPLQLRDAGASFVEIGHSERRAHFGETDETVARKVAAAARNGLAALICVGDTAEDYAAGQSATLLVEQTKAALSRVVDDSLSIAFAYEPVWAIGEAGIPADPDFANDMIAGIAEIARTTLGREISVLYGGSVNQDNCTAFAHQPDVDGLFIGRAAWDARGLLEIAHRFADARSPAHNI